MVTQLSLKCIEIISNSLGTEIELYTKSRVVLFIIINLVNTIFKTCRNCKNTFIICIVIYIPKLVNGCTYYPVIQKCKNATKNMRKILRGRDIPSNLAITGRSFL